MFFKSLNYQEKAEQWYTPRTSLLGLKLGQSILLPLPCDKIKFKSEKLEW